MNTYSHRNGETEAPGMEGKFWFKGKIHHPDYSHDVEDIVEIRLHWRTVQLYIDGDQCNHYLMDAKGQWWGPVIAPWALEQAAAEGVA